MAGTKQGSKDSPDKDTGMPPNLRKTSGGYQYRRVVPAPLRKAIGKTEIKKNLGNVFAVAKKLHAQLEVETNAAFAAAAQSSAKQADETSALDAYVSLHPRSRSLKKLPACTSGLGSQLGALWLQSALTADLARRRGHQMNDDEFDELSQVVDSMLPRINRALASGNVAAFYPVMSGLLVGKGYELEGSDEDIQQLLYDFLKSIQAGYKILAARQSGEVEEAPLPSMAEPLKGVWEKATVTKSEVAWQTLLDHWIKERERPAKTVSETTNLLRSFEAHCKKRPEEVRKSDITAWLQDERSEKGNSAVTLEKKGTLVGAVFSASVKDEKLAVNPFSDYDYKRFATKKGLADDDAREPFTIDDLKLIFSEDGVFTKKCSRGGGGYETHVWYSLLGYFTGCRLDEIGELGVANIKTIDNIPHVGVRQGKNSNSVRDVPIHSKLISLGFLEYVDSVRAAGHISLWPRLKPKGKNSSKSSIFGKWFNNHIRYRLKLSPAKVFHSFRHTFIDECRNAGIDANLHKALTGHIAQDVGDKYGKGFSLTVKSKAIETLPFDIDINLPS